METRFHPKALEDYYKGLAYYDAKSLELGDGFMAEFEASLQRIKESPDRWVQEGKRVRRHEFNRFPFSVIYRVRMDILRIVAVAHHKRRSGYWRRRLKDI